MNNDVTTATSDNSEDVNDLLVTTLAALPPGTLITRKRLAKLLHRGEVSIDRAVKRGELPPPVRLLGMRSWTVGSIVAHIEERLAKAAKTHLREVTRLERLGS